MYASSRTRASVHDVSLKLLLARGADLFCKARNVWLL
jgi:hypothetical protein